MSWSLAVKKKIQTEDREFGSYHFKIIWFIKFSLFVCNSKAKNVHYELGLANYNLYSIQGAILTYFDIFKAEDQKLHSLKMKMYDPSK